MRKLTTAIACSLLLTTFGCAPSPDLAGGSRGNPDADGIQPYPDNPRYWQYKGEPVLLLGGTDDDNLFQWTGTRLTDQLDLLASVEGNYVRNTMSARDSGNVWPFYRRPDGRYDLARTSDEYFERFENLLREAAARDVIVQIELWDRFDFAREPWLENPYRPANNVNYTAEESGLADAYPRHPGQNDNPFFRSIPAHDHNERLLPYQHAQVDRLLEIALRYPNVLYTMDNETSATPEWGAYWSDYIQRKAAAAGVAVYTTEMWDAWDLKDEQHRRTLDHPERYAFADISQNNHNKDQEHWDNLQWVRQYTEATPRPLNHVKIYGADTGRYGTNRDAVERFWRSLIGGAASVRFHRPPSGIGLNETVRAHLRSARMLAEAFDFFRAAPDAESRLLRDRSDDEAYLSSIPGEQYAVYFPDGGSVDLDLSDAEGDFTLKWLDIARSRWQLGETVQGRSALRLQAPGAGHWVVLLERT